jgi:hypothetical protein
VEKEICFEGMHVLCQFSSNGKPHNLNALRIFLPLEGAKYFTGTGNFYSVDWLRGALAQLPQFGL